MARHELKLETLHSSCDTCAIRPAVHWDDFFGYTCNLCHIRLPLRYKQRGINPWG